MTKNLQDLRAGARAEIDWIFKTTNHTEILAKVTEYQDTLIDSVLVLTNLSTLRS